MAYPSHEELCIRLDRHFKKLDKWLTDLAGEINDLEAFVNYKPPIGRVKDPPPKPPDLGP
jgi:hypothetical protein